MIEEKDYRDLAVHVQEIDSRSRSNAHRITDLENDMEKLQETQIALIQIANSVENMGQSIITIKDDVRDVKKSQQELTDKVSEIENRPAIETHKKWTMILDIGIKIIATGIIAAALLHFFPNIPW